MSEINPSGVWFVAGGLVLAASIGFVYGVGWAGITAGAAMIFVALFGEFE